MTDAEGARREHDDDRSRQNQAASPACRFVIVGQKAVASGEFSLLDLPSTSGRLDVLLRCLRAALLFSHGVRRDVTAYVVLLGGEDAPRAVRIQGDRAKFLRPDERAFAILLQKVLKDFSALPLPEPASSAPRFVEIRRGVSVARGALDTVLADIGEGPLYLLEADGEDIRSAAIAHEDCTFVLGDHTGLDEASRALLAERGARSLSVGPREIHAEDAITVLSNELDRRRAPAVT